MLSPYSTQQIKLVSQNVNYFSELRTLIHASKFPPVKHVFRTESLRPALPEILENALMFRGLSPFKKHLRHQLCFYYFSSLVDEFLDEIMLLPGSDDCSLKKIFLICFPCFYYMRDFLDDNNNIRILIKSIQYLPSDAR